jgi:hypothetical protein
MNNLNYENFINWTVKDQDGGTFWVGRFVLDASAAEPLASYSDLFNAAYAACCPAAEAVRFYRETDVLLMRLLAAEALQQSRTLRSLCNAIGISIQELGALATEQADTSRLPCYLYRRLAEALSMPVLLVEYVAGRLLEDDLSELDDLGMKVADRLSELEELVVRQADAVVQDAVARIEAEELFASRARNRGQLGCLDDTKSHGSSSDEQEVDTRAWYESLMLTMEARPLYQR